MIKVSVKHNIDPNLLDGRATKTERAMAWQIMKDTRRFVPAATMSLANRAYVKGTYIIYPGPYARYLHEGVAMVNAATGKGPMYIKDVGYRWPKGATLRPTNRPLNISTAVHKDATSNWMEASKARNIRNWEKIAWRIYTNG